MKNAFCKTIAILLAGTVVAVPAYAQDSDGGYVRVGVNRTKLIDKGDVTIAGTLDPQAGYSTNATEGVTLTAGAFVAGPVALEASITSPVTTYNLPAGSLAGAPNLGDDEFVVVTAGATVHPMKGKAFSPYAGGGLMMQFTTEERDRNAIGLNISNSHGPYIQGGFSYDLGDGLGFYFDAKKAWYHANATGLLPISATQALPVDAKAELDPFVLQAGLQVRFGTPESKNRTAAEHPGRFTMRVGMSQLNLADKFDLSVGGALIENATYATYEHHTPSVQFNYKLTDSIAANATLGFPPTVDVYGSGVIGPITPTKLARVTYGPTAFTLQYAPFKKGVFRPYVGAGVSYMIIFDTDDGLMEDVKAKNDLGPAFEVGSDFMFSDRFGLFIDLKKAMLRTTVTGTFGGAPAEAKAKLDPVVVSGGFTAKF